MYDPSVEIVSIVSRASLKIFLTYFRISVFSRENTFTSSLDTYDNDYFGRFRGGYLWTSLPPLHKHRGGDDALYTYIGNEDQ